jgi:WD40 repeat protein
VPAKAAPQGTLTGATDWVNAVSFSPNGQTVAAGSSQNSVLVWNLPILLAGAQVNSVAFSSDDSMLAVGSQDLQLWDPASRSLLTRLTRLPTPGTTFVNAVAFAPGGRLVAAGYGNGTFQLWRTTGKAPAPLGPELTASHSGMIESVSFSPDGKILATGGDDGLTRLWSVRDQPGRSRWARR